MNGLMKTNKSVTTKHKILDAIHVVVHSSKASHDNVTLLQTTNHDLYTSK